MSFQIHPNGRLVDLLVFLQESRLPFTPPSNEELVAAIMAEIDHPSLTTLLLKSVGLHEILKLIPLTDSTRTFLTLAETGSQLRVCNKAMKHFCGTENLTPDGKITRDAALDLISNYVERNHLQMNGLYVRLDDNLKAALSTNAPGAHQHTLIDLVEAAFESVV
jgi:hypothetical protein